MILYPIASQTLTSTGLSFDFGHERQTNVTLVNQGGANIVFTYVDDTGYSSSWTLVPFSALQTNDEIIRSWTITGNGATVIGGFSWPGILDAKTLAIGSTNKILYTYIGNVHTPGAGNVFASENPSLLNNPIPTGQVLQIFIATIILKTSSTTGTRRALGVIGRQNFTLSFPFGEVLADTGAVTTISSVIAGFGSLSPENYDGNPNGATPGSLNNSISITSTLTMLPGDIFWIGGIPLITGDSVQLKLDGWLVPE